MMGAIELMLAALGGVASPSPTPDLRNPEYDHCLDQSGGVTSDMRACNHAELQRLDALLNAEYRRTMARLPDAAGRARLRTLQRRWLKTRWNACYEAAKEEEGGTIWLLMVDGCGIGTVQDRIEWLRRFR